MQTANAMALALSMGAGGAAAGALVGTAAPSLLSKSDAARVVGSVVADNQIYLIAQENSAVYLVGLCRSN